MTKWQILKAAHETDHEKIAGTKHYLEVVNYKWLRVDTLCPSFGTSLFFSATSYPIAETTTTKTTTTCMPKEWAKVHATVGTVFVSDWIVGTVAMIRLPLTEKKKDKY